MTTPALCVPAAEVEREGNVDRDWELSSEWLRWALANTEAEHAGVPGRLTAHLFKNGKEILVRGRLRARVEMRCARTLDPTHYDIDTELTLILHKRPDSDAGGHRNRAGRGRKKEEEPAISEEDAATDTYSGELIVLDDFVREQLLLELPMFPLRSDLRSSESPAIPAPPQPASSGAGIDPRLLPLQALAEKLKSGK